MYCKCREWICCLHEELSDGEIGCSEKEIDGPKQKTCICEGLRCYAYIDPCESLSCNDPSQTSTIQCFADSKSQDKSLANEHESVMKLLLSASALVIKLEFSNL